MKKLSGFTLVELLVAMAIIGVLIALAIYGVSAAQRAQRDTARKSASQDISVGIQDYYDRNSIYPDWVSYIDGYVYLYRSGTTCASQANLSNKCVAVPLKGNIAPGSNVAAGSFSNASPIKYLGGATNANESRYCIHIEDDGYTLGGKLENETWIHVGSTARPATCT